MSTLTIGPIELPKNLNVRDGNIRTRLENAIAGAVGLVLYGEDPDRWAAFDDDELRTIATGLASVKAITLLAEVDAERESR